jgi:predicted RNA-binding Zn-ribbon protein involved in translation (DUF1610 family)
VVKEFSSQTWQVELQCPQCGAPLVIEETDRILSCSYCRVRLYMDQEGDSRYYIAPRVTSLEDVLFVPYWRFKGMVFSLDEQGVAQRLVDSNLLALRSQGFPFSLGIRPQVLRLKPITPGIKGKFLDPDFPFHGYHMNLEKVPAARGSSVGGHAPLFKAFIGEMVSLIYAPFYINDGRLFDAVLDCPASQSPEESPEDLPYSRDVESKTRFLPMLCPSCGWDLEGEKNALVLLCKNCDSAWQASGGSLENLDFAFMPTNNDTALHLPFWRIRARISGFKLNSYADFVRFANLPKAIQSAWEENPMTFWIPAFKIQPLLFLRLARIFTVSQPSSDPEKTIGQSSRHPVALPLSDAVEAVKVLIVSLAVQKESIFAKLSGTAISLDECSLVYVPFIRRGTELIHPEMQVSISANALNWGRLL